ncbi:phosphotransferase enzyme family protein [Hirsutella rhossiliensis]|uniref:Phosphotransferase enzyme family domain-containing protein n=1 Tax=Hirsutella rhossiliensis TaxID=111463 RepID=A0A9P8MXM0_9HYPO|nr:phosphotransferase enzyme family domain-containing protein [Hirsutella rhossiliensis]KAH0964208.1 phosphotransferase enzyme family domain-containing protein [Hirsutella rhossiliensis]
MEPVSRHLQTIKQNAEDFQSRFPLVDRFRPSFAPAHGAEIATLISPTISYYYTTKVFVKRQPHQDELGLDVYGNPMINPYIADRLRNEAAALQFIAKHTTIPVPEFLDLWEDNGLVYLKTALVGNGVELQHVDETLLSTATKSVTAQLESDILPQLRRLRRNFMGSPNPELPVIPPRRLWDWKEKRVWPLMTKDTDEYVFCHTDLDRQNILVDPNTFKILCILDWETAGFFPQEWDLPYWTANGPREKHQMSMEAKRWEITSFDFPGTIPNGALSPASIQV